MKRISLITAIALLVLCGACDKYDPIIDWAPFRVEFVILDTDGENVVLKDAEAVNKVSVLYDGKLYEHANATRDMFYDIALTTTGSANEIFVFGDWDLNTDGSFKVRYGEQNWVVDFESYATFSGNSDVDINVMVDGVPGEKYIDSGDYQISINGECIFKSGVYILRVK